MLEKWTQILEQPKKNKGVLTSTRQHVENAGLKSKEKQSKKG